MNNGMVTKKKKQNVLYLNIAQGNLVQKVDDDHPDATVRKFERPDGTIGTTTEIEYMDVSGVITGVKVEKGKYGTQAHVYLQSGENRAALRFPYESDYFTDFAKRLPGVDLTKPVTLKPYQIENDEGEYPSRGISVQQDGEKFKNYFYDPDKKKTLHGMPSVSKKEAAKYDSEDWKLYFGQVRKFLRNTLEALEYPDYNPVVDGPSDVGGDSGKTLMTPKEAFEAPVETLPEGVEPLPWDEK